MRGRGGAKVILLGEHVVVYGRPALAAGLAQGVEAFAAEAREDRLRVSAWGADAAPGDGTALGTAFGALLDTFGVERAPLEVHLEVAVPSGAGLGGSAASGVAIAEAVGRLLGVEEGRDAIAERALAWERVFHGDASGLDPAIAARGGVLRFVRGGERTPVPTGRLQHFVVADSGDRASTKAMVQAVATRWEAARRETEDLFDEVAELVEGGCEALRVGADQKLGRAMLRNQELLERLGVSTATLGGLCDAAVGAGAVGAKLTGSGGGGCILALASDAASAAVVAEALAARGARTMQVEVGR